ncbi:MAG TPA: Bug family tripartite tricarboxylate transporter substrate binding protein [Burkholderiaceae bacterium]
MSRLSRRTLLQASAAAGACVALDRTAWATEPVVASTKIVVGFAAGGTADVVARRVAEQLHPAYARSAYVDNRTGAGGQIAVQAVKAAAPDGTTVLLTPMSMLGIYPHTYRKLPYDPVADLTPVSTGAIFDYGFAVGPLVPVSVKTVADFLAWAQAHPGQANYGSPAAGSSPHFIGVLLGRAAGVELTHVPFRGSQPAILDMVSGQIAAVCGPVGEFLQFAAAGKCRLLGTSGNKRSRFTPSVPTLAEQGYKDLTFSEWYGFYLPAKAPQAMVERLGAAIHAAVTAPDVIEGLTSAGLEPHSCTPAQLATMLRADSARWGALVKSIGFTADA